MSQAAFDPMACAQRQGIWLGLTGGIGSGKSAVAQLLRDQSADISVLDMDLIARQLTGSGGAAMPLIQQAFGDEFQTPDGALDRNKMRQLVFDDQVSKESLESILHPLVRHEAMRQAGLTKAKLLVFEIPLLAESAHWRAVLDRILVVDCHVQTQIQRVCQRSGLTPQAVQAIIATQASREQRLAIADLVLFNDVLSFSELSGQVAQIAALFGL